MFSRPRPRADQRLKYASCAAAGVAAGVAACARVAKAQPRQLNGIPKAGPTAAAGVGAPSSSAEQIERALRGASSSLRHAMGTCHKNNAVFGRYGHILHGKPVELRLPSTALHCQQSWLKTTNASATAEAVPNARTHFNHTLKTAKLAERHIVALHI